MTNSTFRLEFFVEPFIEGQPGPHVDAAVKAVERAGLEVEVGPFGSVASGDTKLVLKAARDLLEDSLEAGASRISLQLAAGPDQDSPGSLAMRSLHDALQRMISAVESELGAPLAELPRVDKQAAVRMLDEQGVFLLRKAVEDVADAMGVTRITIYNYLNAIRDET